jgi:hypothetical protein
MTADPRISLLRAEIAKTRAVLERIDAFYRQQAPALGPLDARTTAQAIVLADVLVSFYTCLETVFLRVSQHFENTLDPEKWHRELLGRMTLELPGIRERVLSQAAYQLLGEFLRFRHFKRYYFDFQYDWDRLEFLRARYERLQPLIAADLDRFDAFLARLGDATGPAPA